MTIDTNDVTCLPYDFLKLVAHLTKYNRVSVLLKMISNYDILFSCYFD